MATNTSGLRVARSTPDGRLSIIDFIGLMQDCNEETATESWERLVKQYPHLTDSVENAVFAEAAEPEELEDDAFLKNGEDSIALRKKAVDTRVRIWGGDLTFINEVRANQQPQDADDEQGYATALHRARIKRA